MKAVLAIANRCEVKHIAKPKLGPREVLVRVSHTAFNRADTLQRKGAYPPPPGVTEVMGLECAGTIEEIAPDCGRKGELKVGTRVMALLAGGGYAEFAAVHEGSVMCVPKNLDLRSAAAIPEVFLTAFQLLEVVGHLRSEDAVLIHAGASGVGTAAIQLCKSKGCQAIVVTTSEEKLDFCRSLGATHAFDRRKEWASRVNAALAKPSSSSSSTSPGPSIDLVLDCVGTSILDQNLKVLKVDSRWVLFGLMGGWKVPSLDTTLFREILTKRIAILGSTLRARHVDYKADLVGRFTHEALPKFESGELRPILDKREFTGLESAEEALNYLQEDTTVGKVVMSVL